MELVLACRDREPDTPLEPDAVRRSSAVRAVSGLANYCQAPEDAIEMMGPVP